MKRAPPARVPRRASEWRVLAAGLMLLSTATATAATDHAPAPWQFGRDSNPFVAAGGLPFAPPTTRADGGWHLDAVLAASNTEIGISRGDEQLRYDMEIHELRLAVSHSFGERWVARASTALVRFDQGFLDGFVEDFHRVFGFDNGDRGRLPGNGHTIRYSDSEGHAVELARARSGLAPLLLDLAWRAPGEGSEWLLGGTLKIPTSHVSPLIDDRATDLSLWTALQSTGATRWRWGARAGVWFRGEGDLLDGRRKDQVPFVDGVLGFQITPQWDVAAQYQWHGAPYDSAISLLRSAGTLTLSSAWHADSGWSLRAGLVEDLPARHAQDVTFFVGLSR